MQPLHRWFLPIVSSAYRLGMEAKICEEDRGTTSARPYGENREWSLIWHGQAPPKVKTFAWKLARNGLATRVNMARRKMITEGTCPICGRGEEDTYHALITYPQSRDLWQCMREVWDLSSTNKIKRVGTDWLLPLLDAIDDNKSLKVVMILWRV
uniref:Uncharacterized protein n=1 Tax=Avena sativa TaxID=4498 RepID=A0ACD5T8B2_AVESA